MNFLSRFIQEIPSYVISLPMVLLAISFHEMSHAYVSYKLGDPTAKNLGRMTLNPAKHIDPLGFICMVLCHVGWARPVMSNSRNFKNPRRDIAISAAAGPLSNVLLAIICTVVLRLMLIPVASAFEGDLQAIVYASYTGSAYTVSRAFSIVAVLAYMIYVGVVLNLSYALFNMIPIPPWDGSRVLYAFLPPKLYFGIMKYERYIMMIMLILLWTGILSLPLGAGVNFLTGGLFRITGMKSVENELYIILYHISKGLM